MVGGSRKVIRDADASAVEPIRIRLVGLWNDPGRRSPTIETTRLGYGGTDCANSRASSEVVEKPGIFRDAGFLRPCGTNRSNPVFKKNRVSQHTGRTGGRVLRMIFYEGREIFPAVLSRFSFPGRTGHPPSRCVRLDWSPVLPGKYARESGGGGSKNAKTSARGRGDNLYIKSKSFEKPPPKRPHHFWPPKTSSGVEVGGFGGRVEIFFASENRRVGDGIVSMDCAPERLGNSW
jgi:hypothetical protein